MTRAYSDIYLWDAQNNLAVMLDFSVNGLGYDPAEFFDMFIRSGIADEFGSGNFCYITGMSGTELCDKILESFNLSSGDAEPVFGLNYSPEYWAGWALAYYQWYSGRSFKEITDIVPIDDIITMYHPYHEMDISHFTDDMEDIRRRRQAARKKKKEQSSGTDAVNRQERR